jgi:hypothetical protein
MNATMNVDDHAPRQPASIYRLRIAGVIPDGWEERLGCLRAVREEGPEPQTVTTLMGAVTDQSDLLGILNTLHELRLTLLLVEAIDPDTFLPEPAEGKGQQTLSAPRVTRWGSRAPPRCF